MRNSTRTSTTECTANSYRSLKAQYDLSLNSFLNNKTQSNSNSSYFFNLLLQEIYWYPNAKRNKLCSCDNNYELKNFKFLRVVSEIKTLYHVISKLSWTATLSESLKKKMCSIYLDNSRNLYFLCAPFDLRNSLHIHTDLS